VTIYLTAEAIDTTLRSVSQCGSGSEIVLSYDAADAFLDDTAQEMVRIEARLTAVTGEPYTTRMSPAQAEALIEGAGLEVGDGLRPPSLSASSPPGQANRT
jgi:O-methyltransferase involved in polyketide biosynthesis